MSPGRASRGLGSSRRGSAAGFSRGSPGTTGAALAVHGCLAVPALQLLSHQSFHLVSFQIPLTAFTSVTLRRVRNIESVTSRGKKPWRENASNFVKFRDCYSYCLLTSAMESSNLAIVSRLFSFAFSMASSLTRTASILDTMLPMECSMRSTRRLRLKHNGVKLLFHFFYQVKSYFSLLLQGVQDTCFSVWFNFA